MTTNIQKKLSLIFIRIFPFILGIDVLLKTLFCYGTVNLIWSSITSTIINLIFIIGFIILSFTFKFCLYHRLLLYFVILYDIIYILNNVLVFNLTLVLFIDLLTIVTICVLFIIIHFYFKLYYKKKE